MKKALMIVLILFAAFGVVATMFIGVAALRGSRVSAAGLPQERGWGWMPMMGQLYRSDSAQSGCPGANTGRGSGMMGGAGMMGGNGMMGGAGMMGGSGMMGGYRSGNNSNRYGSCPFTDGAQSQPNSGDRLTIEQALANVEAYLGNDADLSVAEVMEFEDNFYAVIHDETSSKGAMELLVDPFTGSVYPEYGPNMMWNQKYGHMGRWFSGDEQLTLDDAAQAAQQALDDQLPGAEVEGMGFEFPGYFTFDYAVDGQITGMLSVNASTGDAWLHTWHGAFITEIELEE